MSISLTFFGIFFLYLVNSFKLIILYKYKDISLNLILFSKYIFTNSSFALIKTVSKSEFLSGILFKKFNAGNFFILIFDKFKLFIVSILRLLD